MSILLIAALLFPAAPGPQAGLRDGPRIEPLAADFSFEGEMSFSANVYTVEPVLESRLVLQYDGSQYDYPARQSALADGCALEVQAGPAGELPFPFALVTYWWEADFASGLQLRSDPESFRFSDTGFTWKILEFGLVTVGWAGEGTETPEDAAELALLAAGTVSADLETPIPAEIRIYIYPNMADFLAALGERVYGWEGALFSPENGIIVLAAAPGAEGRKTLALLIPHEITHLLLGVGWGGSASRFPYWLEEGLAVGYEMEARPEADLALREAVDGGSLIPLRALCDSFPSEETPAVLAYAESRSFVAYLRERFGLAAIRSALAAYAGGADCNGGVQEATGKPLSTLEADWRKGLSGGASGFQSPWSLVITGLVLLAGVLFFRRISRRRYRGTAAERKEVG